jgi:hypothetical protein
VDIRDIDTILAQAAGADAGSARALMKLTISDYRNWQSLAEKPIMRFQRLTGSVSNSLPKKAD